ncbi:MAG: hypothetical protein SGCHY_002374, partial [Lobulomycetales sp.]
METEILKHQNQIAELEQQQAKLTAEMDELKESLEEKNKKYKQLKQQAREMIENDKGVSLTEELEKSQKSTSRWKEKAMELERNLAAQNRSSNSLDKRLQVLEKEKRALEKRLDNAGSEKELPKSADTEMIPASKHIEHAPAILAEIPAKTALSSNQEEKDSEKLEEAVDQALKQVAAEVEAEAVVKPKRKRAPRKPKIVIERAPLTPVKKNRQGSKRKLEEVVKPVVK